MRGSRISLTVEDEAAGVSASIIAQKKELEEEKKKDSLARKLSLRPSKGDLKQKNILKENGSLEDVSEASFESKQSQLKSILKKRPNKSELEQQNILKSNGASAALVSAQESLKRSILEDTLANKINNRPTVEELEDKKILFAETVEVLPTFRKSEYNRKPDATATFKNLTQQMKVEIREELNNYKKEEMDVHPEIAAMDKNDSKRVPLPNLPEIRRVKILSLGDSGTGKSCMIKRYCEGRFLEEYVSTIGIDFGVKSFATEIEEGSQAGFTVVKINFWDCAGDDIYFDIRNEFYKDTHAAFMVFDVSDRTTFDNILKWQKEFRDFATGTVELVLVGNKIDKERVVQTSEGKKLAAEIGARLGRRADARYFETSALTGDNIQEMFSELFYATLELKFAAYAKPVASALEPDAEPAVLQDGEPDALEPDVLPDVAEPEALST
ncbi:DnaJ sub C member 27 [Kappamyces sp. JEL0680]|nr:DnaJ sub C member 27 [Kappamyces sp. JEL0680]